MMKPTQSLLASLLVVLAVGCRQEPAAPPVADQPSYADLVVTYNAEAETLDRLQRQRSELIASQMPNADDALQSLTDVLNSAAVANEEKQNILDQSLTTEQALDQAVANAENAQQVAEDLLNAVVADEEGQPDPPVVDEEFQKQLVALDTEIAQQQQRVDRARKARDAASP